MRRRPRRSHRHPRGRRGLPLPACRRSVGAAYVTWATYAAEAARFVRSAPTWWRSSHGAERGSCAARGASLAMRAAGGGPWIDLTVASHDAPGALPPARAIWLESHLPWVPLTPDLPRHDDAGPPRRPRRDLRWQEGAPVDADQLAALFRDVGFTRASDPASLRALVDGSRRVISAWSGDALVAFARAISDGTANAYVSMVAVRSDHQRRGVGRGLMRRLLAGRDAVKFVLKTSEAGEPLHRSLGFVDGERLVVRPRA